MTDARGVAIPGEVRAAAAGLGIPAEQVAMDLAGVTGLQASAQTAQVLSIAERHSTQAERGRTFDAPGILAFAAELLAGAASVEGRHG